MHDPDLATRAKNGGFWSPGASIPTSKFLLSFSGAMIPHTPCTLSLLSSLELMQGYSGEPGLQEQTVEQTDPPTLRKSLHVVRPRIRQCRARTQHLPLSTLDRSSKLDQAQGLYIFDICQMTVQRGAGAPAT